MSDQAKQRTVRSWVQDLGAGLAILGLLAGLSYFGALRALELPSPDPQQQTQNEMRSVGRSLLAWLTDQVSASAAGACGFPVDLNTYSAITHGDLQDLLVPRYAPEVPEHDAWGHSFDYYLDATSIADARMSIRSPGADGSFEGTSYLPGVVSSADDDLMWADGYFIRRALPASDRQAQQETVDDVRSIGTAMFAWLSDIISRNAQEGFAVVDLTSYDQVGAGQVEDVLVPDYLRCLPHRDGWGHAYSFYLDTFPLPGEQHLAAVRSPGVDGHFEGTVYLVGSFPAFDPDGDIVWADGYFVRWPDAVRDTPAPQAAAAPQPVNATTAGDQQAPAVAVPAAGSALAFWQAPAADGLGIVARLLDADGTPAGAEIPVETRPAGDQAAPDASAGGGQAVVVWRTGADPEPGIAARRVDDLGQPQGSERAVNLTPADASARPAVAVAGDGSFLVAWAAAAGATADDGSEGTGTAILLRPFAANGFALGGEKTVHPAGASQRSRPALTASPDGTYLVVWEDDDGAGRGIFGRRFDATGTALGPVQRMHRHTAGDQRNPAVATDPEGRFVVIWYEEEGIDGPGGSLLARRFDPNLEPLGLTSFVGLAESPTEGTFSSAPSLAFDDLGYLLVAWPGISVDSSEASILAQKLDPAGRSQGGDLTLDSGLGNNPLAPAVASGPNSDYLVLWTDTDASGDGILARGVGDRVFLDGFERGDVGPWLE
ncbi:MAG: hypothetical protein SX243_23610 [Acidobacteriota bacterium]|nr:hypothetical protein [Acidobacteriota bacterium]